MSTTDLPLKLIFTRWYNSIRDWVLADVQQMIGNTIVGGKIVGSKVSGTIPTSSVPAHASTHKSGGSDTITPFGGEFSATDLVASGLTGATAASRYVGATTSGAPGSGTFAKGDFIIDQTGKIYVCTTAGSPGTWTVISGSGGGGGGNVTYNNAYASTPGSPASGDLWLPSDSILMSRYNGTSWDWRFGTMQVTLPPASANWTAVNAGTSTIADSGGAVAVTSSTNGTQESHLWVKAIPTAPYTVTMALIAPTFFDNYGGFGMVLRESSSGKLVTFGSEANSFGPYNAYRILKWTSPTAVSATYGDITGYMAKQSPISWFQVSDNGTNRIWRMSVDGQNFTQIHSVAHNDFFTSAADQIGFFFEAGATYALSGSLLHWKEA